MTDFRPGSLDSRTRVRHGKERERQIAIALREQVGLPIRDASEYEDKERKVDRWIAYPGGRVALQIKYREVGQDLLFEVYDKWFGWDHPHNKLGRDVDPKSISTEYAVLLSDRKTVVMVPTDLAKDIIAEMCAEARNGWTRDSYTKTLDYYVHGLKLQLKAQHDPADGRPKMVAYIPAEFFIAEAQAKVYQVALPNEWKV